MSIKKICFYNALCLFILLFLPHCKRGDNDALVSVNTARGKKNKKLGVSYYKMSFLELEQEEPNERNYRKALFYLDKAIAQERNPRYLAQKATILFLLEKFKESRKCFQKALKMPMPANVRSEILNNYACLLAKKGERDKALDIFKQLAHDKNYLTPEVALVNQARIHYENGNITLAREKFARAVVFSPQYVDAHYYLGLACHRAGDYRAALQTLNKVIELEPKHSRAIALREQCCTKLAENA